jgi:hypothetical protein
MRSNPIRFVLYRGRGAARREKIMRSGGIVLAAALTALSASAAKADEWCGYAGRDNAVIECGYTTSADCEDSVGKRGVCFVDPDLALEATRATLLPRHPDATPLPRKNG